ncbi:putative alpha/beta hydrolase [Dothidotthia symphoricarpi CBS 119687]|uniref:Putative alpha/beta hydrolase n=1 Tax=Dothidotthia symphoricarpi CBS 119687 TaxID=1392245 RepID=A0A6A6A549_9PLEO|nr:putative alpha/beta hydrolase [Dothidotthia symphoricarpi CBS 119687]KAF2126666.1 putative alpha/beta hydrolase [Dothidotthia symphoricarpi CBS 119687]
MPSQTLQISITHLGSLTVGYRLAAKINPSKPTLICINSMCMTSALFDAQFSDEALTAAVNLLAIEPLGHGQTSFPEKVAQFTYWDSAIVALEVMSCLGVERAFAMGTSQGGWMVVRMGVLAPERILGLLPLGTSIDAETTESREKGCWNPTPLLHPFVELWKSSTPTPDYIIDDTWCNMVASFGFGSHATPATTAFWTETIKSVYSGDEGRRKARMAVLCLLERDSLCLRVADVTCPVYWLQGSEDAPYGAQVQREQIEMFSRSRDARLSIVEGGAHYLNATNPREVNGAVLDMLRKYA